MKLGLGLQLGESTRNHAAVAAVGTFTVVNNRNLPGAKISFTITVVDWTLMAGGTLDAFGFGTFTEGVDFFATTSNSVTANSIRDAVNTAFDDEVIVTDGTGAMVFSAPDEVFGLAITYDRGGLSPNPYVVTEHGSNKTQVSVDDAFQTFDAEFDPVGGIWIGNNNAECAANIAAWINSQPMIRVTAISQGNIVIATATTPGSAGNLIPMTSQWEIEGAPHSQDCIPSGEGLLGGADAS